ERRPRAGLTRALNLALGLARAPIVARLDADDVALPERLARQVAFLDAHPEIGVLGRAAREANRDGREVRVVRPPEDDAALRRARRGPAACRGAGALASGARRRLSTVVPGVRGPAAARAGRAGAVAPRAATLPRMTPPPGPILELLVSTQPGGGPQHVLAVA